MVHQKIQKHIEIIRSTTAALNSMGKKSCDAIYDLLQQHYATVGVTIVNSKAELDQVVVKRPDLVFTGVKYVPGELPDTKLWVSEYLEQHGIRYTGSPQRAIELEQDKPLAKQRVLDAGVKTSPYVVVKAGDMLEVEGSNLHFPLFVKPADLGAGKGIDEQSVVHNQKELDAKLTALGAHGRDILIELFLSGREYSVAMLKDEYSDDLTAMPLELVTAPDTRGYRILSKAVKSAALETPVFPVTDPATRAALIDVAANAFAALGAQNYGRIDIRMDANNVSHFLEANLLPCLINGSGNFPKACAMNIGMDYETMILHIVRLGMADRAEPVEYESHPIVVRNPAVVLAVA